MTYYGGKELAEAFRKVRKNTIQIAEDIPEDNYGFKPSTESRSIAQTLAHIATATTFPMMLHGERIPVEKIDFAEYMKTVAAEEAKLQTKAQIIAKLRESGDKFTAMLESLTDDAFFAELKKHFTEAQIVELTAAIAMENFRSKFNPPLGIEAQGFCMVPSKPKAA